MRPETTGDTENGRSINVIRKLFPRKSNFVIAQEAATPKTMLSGTAIAATSKVSFIAIQASGSATASRSEEHTSELQSLMRNSYAVFCLKKKRIDKKNNRRM